MKHTACNPVLPISVCMADGEPHVFGERVYLFGSHDTPGGESFCLEDYEFFSTPLDDLSHWTSRGTNYSAKQDPLYGENARYLYAPDVVRGNDGRYYLYYCLAGWKGKSGYSHPISVAVCDSPDGKYDYCGVVQNPDGTPYQGFVCFDPAVMNDNGVIRLYFGTGPFRGMAVKPWNAFVLSRVYSGVFGKPAKAFLQTPGPLGANAAVLCDDMLTLKEPPKRIADTPDFKDHAFFEGSSIRKIGQTYCFVYSSQKNHELCYATSGFPDRDFRYRGTLVSNGDVGYDGRSERKRCNATGTTHGGIEQIGGKWYVFYHRLTHGSDYSRQMCAEPLAIRLDGSIAQVEMTSCGLNGGDLPGTGEYPAAICCNLTNGEMPHIANQIRKNIPIITHSDVEWYVGNAARETQIGYKYFSMHDQWERQGFIQTTEGNVVHYGFIEKFICELGERYNIREIAYDRWNATMMVQALEDDGFTMIPFGQGFRDMSPPTKELMRIVLEHRLNHGGHPVLHWNFDNAYVRTDPAGNLKLDKEKSTEKIDGAVALVMALDRAMKNQNGGDSVYNDRGLLLL